MTPDGRRFFTAGVAEFSNDLTVLAARFFQEAFELAQPRRSKRTRACTLDFTQFRCIWFRRDEAGTWGKRSWWVDKALGRRATKSMSERKAGAGNVCCDGLATSRVLIYPRAKDGKGFGLVIIPFKLANQ